MDKYVKVIAVAISAMFMVTLLPAAYASSDAQLDIDDGSIATEEVVDYGKVTFTDRSMIIYSDELNSYADSLKDSTSKIVVSDDLTAHAKSQIAVIDGEWASTQNEESLVDQTHKLISDGTPVISIANSPELLINSNKGGFSSYADDAKVYGLYMDSTTGNQYCISVVCEDIDSALLRAYNWADRMISESDTSSSSGDVTNASWVRYGCETFYQCINKDGKDFGWANIRTHYYKLSDISDEYEYYYTHFKLDIVPNRDRLTGEHAIAIADSTIRSDVKADPTYGKYQEMMCYGPIGDSGITTSAAQVDLSFSAGYNPGSGGSIGGTVSVSWQYSVSDIVVHDKSSIGQKLEIWQDINEHKNVGKTTCTMEPGHVVRCQNTNGGDGKYHAVDQYEVVFITFAFWHDFFDTFTFNQNVIVPSDSACPST